MTYPAMKSPFDKCSCNSVAAKTPWNILHRLILRKQPKFLTLSMWLQLGDCILGGNLDSCYAWQTGSIFLDEVLVLHWVKLGFRNIGIVKGFSKYSQLRPFGPLLLAPAPRVHYKYYV